MKQLKKSISTALKQYRKNHKITQEAFAEELGISVEFYGEIERQKKVPSSRLIVKMYHLMGYDYIPISGEIVDNDNISELFHLISISPEMADVLLKIAKALINR